LVPPGPPEPRARKETTALLELTATTGPPELTETTDPPDRRGPLGSTVVQVRPVPPGPAGNTGPAGPGGISEYAYIYSTVGKTVAIEANVTFDSNGVLSPGITHSTTTDTDQIVLVNSGTYKVAFSVSGTEPSQMALFVNGVGSRHDLRLWRRDPAEQRAGDHHDRRGRYPDGQKPQLERGRHARLEHRRNAGGCERFSPHRKTRLMRGRCQSQSPSSQPLLSSARAARRDRPPARFVVTQLDGSGQVHYEAR
jgi:hypothetical protein